MRLLEPVHGRDEQDDREVSQSERGQTRSTDHRADGLDDRVVEWFDHDIGKCKRSEQVCTIRTVLASSGDTRGQVDSNLGGVRVVE